MQANDSNQQFDSRANRAVLLGSMLFLAGIFGCSKGNHENSPAPSTSTTAAPATPPTAVAVAGPKGPEQSKAVNGITISLRGDLQMPSSEVQIEGKNAEGQFVDLGKVKLELTMDMPGMPMHGSGVVSGTNGQYTAAIKPDMRGEWTAKVTFDGSKGGDEASFRVMVK